MSAEGSLQQPDATITSRASVPATPSSPNIPLIGLGAALFSLLDGAVSMLIAELWNRNLRSGEDVERELGVALLERTTREVALTPAGAALLASGREVLAAAVRAIAADAEVMLLAGPQGATAAALLPGPAAVRTWSCPWIGDASRPVDAALVAELRAIIEEVLLHVMYDVPSREDIAKVVVTAEVVRDNVNPTLVPRASESKKKKTA